MVAFTNLNKETVGKACGRFLKAVVEIRGNFFINLTYSISRYFHVILVNTSDKDVSIILIFV